MEDKTCLQHDKQKQMRNGTLRNIDTLTCCLLIVRLMGGVSKAWKFGLGDITSDERAVNGPVWLNGSRREIRKPLTYW
ncbi:rpoE leader peptide RseD [Salmonella enterica subsp. enterica serovar Senftenberg]|nr:rpoE leader peptide RseD [Salmonella enterica subsp. enterica serovar Senftenberg]